MNIDTPMMVHFVASGIGAAGAIAAAAIGAWSHRKIRKIEYSVNSDLDRRIKQAMEDVTAKVRGEKEP